MTHEDLISGIMNRDSTTRLDHPIIMTRAGCDDRLIDDVMRATKIIVHVHVQKQLKKNNTISMAPNHF